MTNFESFVLGLFIGFLLTSTAVIIDTAKHHKPPIPREATWDYPEIAQCDKELWLRIKDGCDVEID